MSKIHVARQTHSLPKVKDPGSAATHFIAFCATLVASPVLLRQSVHLPGPQRLSLLVFLVSMALLYAASTTYHTLDLGTVINRRLKKLDHMMIFVLIAGTYTPYCTVVLGGPAGRRLLITVWAIALAGIALKACWVTCPKWFSSVTYIALGWACLADTPKLYAASSPATFGLLLAGGVLYTVGGVIYALKLPVFNRRFPQFGSHEVFHLFVMGGSLCHYLSLLLAV